MGAFDLELAALGYEGGSASIDEEKPPVEPAIGMRVEYGDGETGTVQLVSDEWVIVRRDTPKEVWGCSYRWEDAVPKDWDFYGVEGEEE